MHTEAGLFSIWLINIYSHLFWSLVIMHIIFKQMLVNIHGSACCHDLDAKYLGLNEMYVWFLLAYLP